MPKIPPEALRFDEWECFGCGADLWLQEHTNYSRHIDLCIGCHRTDTVISIELTDTFRRVVETGRYRIPAIELAYAIEDFGGQVDGTRTYQWRRRRIDQLKKVLGG